MGPSTRLGERWLAYRPSQTLVALPLIVAAGLAFASSINFGLVWIDRRRSHSAGECGVSPYPLVSQALDVDCQ